MYAKNKKRRSWLIIPIIIIALGSYIALMLWRQMKEETAARFALYPSFGISIPLGYVLHGIDVSAYQQYIYWPAIKKMQVSDVKIDFVFIKATEGLNNTDKMFTRNWQNAKQAGITRGAYHFFLATKSGKMQAENFIKQVKLQPGDLPPVLDVENLYGTNAATMRREVMVWLQTIEAYYKVKPIIYSYADFYNANFNDTFARYPLWVAHYYEEGKPRIKRDWIFWQHNETAKVNGIATKVDFNVFAGDTSEFKSLLVK